MPCAADSSRRCTTLTSHDPVTRSIGARGDRTIVFVTVAVGMPVISARNVDEKSMSGETETIAALSCLRSHSFRFAYTHQTKARTCPRSLEV